MSEVESTQVSGQSTESSNAGAAVTPDVSTSQPSPSVNENAGMNGPAGAASHGSEGVTQGEAAAIADAAYKANLKFQVRGKEQTFEDWLHPFIKDAETEKRVRTLHEKAYGIDVVKEERKQFQEMAQTYHQELVPLKRDYQRLSGYLANGDLATFQRETNVPDELILKRARDILVAQGNPDLKAAQDRAYDEARRARELEEQNETLSSQYESTVVTQLRSDLDATLSNPEVAQVAQQFDQRRGQPGAFRDEIIKRGQFYALSQNVMKSPQEIVSEFMEVFGMQPQASQAPTQGAPTATPVVAAPAQGMAPQVVPVQKPVIPNVQGRGTSPVKKQIKSIEDLKQRHRELAMSNQS